MLCVSEAVTNSVRHSRSGQPRPQGENPDAPGTVTLRVYARDGGPLHIDVQDEGPRQHGGLPHLDPGGADPLAESGRGMHLIDRHTRHWMVFPPGSGCLSLTFDTVLEVAAVT